MLRYGNRGMDLCKASKEGNVDKVCQLIKQKVDINEVPKSVSSDSDLRGDWTALMHAVHYRCVVVCEELLRVHADTERQDEGGNTGMHIAVGLKDDRSCKDLVCLLARHGANVNAVNKRGETAGHIATDNDDVTTLEELWSHGADFSLRNNEGKRPLDVAQDRKMILKTRKAPAFLQSCMARLQPRHRCPTRGEVLQRMETAEKLNQKQSEELRSKNTQIESLKREVERLEAESREWQELCTSVAKRNRLDKA